MAEAERKRCPETGEMVPKNCTTCSANHPECRGPVIVVGKKNSPEKPCKFCGSTTGCDCPLEIVEVSFSTLNVLQKVLTALKTLNSLFLELFIDGPDKYVYEYTYNLFIIVALLKPKRILDLGTGGKGIAMRAMLAGLIFNGLGGHITTVEINRDYYRQMHVELKEKVVLMGNSDMVTFVYGDDLNISCSERFDLVFIDTSHTYEHTLAELEKFSEWTSLMVCHDTQAVQKAIDKFLETRPEWSFAEVGATPYGLGILFKLQ